MKCDISLHDKTPLRDDSTSASSCLRSARSNPARRLLPHRGQTRRSAPVPRDALSVPQVTQTGARLRRRRRRAGWRRGSRPALREAVPPLARRRRDGAASPCHRLPSPQTSGEAAWGSGGWPGRGNRRCL